MATNLDIDVMSRDIVADLVEWVNPSLSM